jgi:hypothetical protein
MKHTFLCKKFNIEEQVIEYEFKYSNNVNKVERVYERFVKNYNKREELLNKMKNYVCSSTRTKYNAPRKGFFAHNQS